jgi:hypothetical protein
LCNMHITSIDKIDGYPGNAKSNITISFEEIAS